MVDDKKFRMPSLSSIALFIVFLIISITFFYMLSNTVAESLQPGESNPYEFGLKSILFSIVISALTSLFFVWIKSFMAGKPYLGLMLGVIVLGSVEYAITHKFEGPKTTVFAIIIAVITIGYLGYLFVKLRESGVKNSGETFNDS